jgi:Xaa-Pro aminopeptidase
MKADPQAQTPFDPWQAISADEFRARQEKAREAAREQGFDALVVWSRGGAFVDMAQDVLYLSGHYSQQPYMGDEAGIGSARSHGVCIIPVEGPVTVVVDVPWWRRDIVVADQVKPSIDVAGTAAAVVRELGLDTRTLGLVGASYMTAAAYLGFVERLPNATITRADRLVERIRMIKSPAEIDLIRRSAALGSQAMDAMLATVVEGRTEAEAVAEAAHVLYANGAVLYDAACASGPQAHRYTHARLPSADSVRHFQKGDMFHVDFYGSYGGYFFDFARSRVVGDQPSAQQRAMINATIEVVETICDGIRPGMTAGDVYAIGDDWMKASPFIKDLPVDEPEMEGFPAFGHGIGLMWEMPWIMSKDPTVLEPGVYLGIEMLLGHHSRGGAMFEENGIVTKEGFEILTSARKRWW